MGPTTYPCELVNAAVKCSRASVDARRQRAACDATVTPVSIYIQEHAYGGLFHEYNIHSVILYIGMLSLSHDRWRVKLSRVRHSFSSHVKLQNSWNNTLYVVIYFISLGRGWIYFPPAFYRSVDGNTSFQILATPLSTKILRHDLNNYINHERVCRSQLYPSREE